MSLFKAMFDRPRDWVGITTPAESNPIDLHEAADRSASLLPGDPRVERVRRGGT